MATLDDLEASIRGATDQDVAGPISQTLIRLWINEEMLLMARRLAVVIPDRYTKHSSDFAGADTFNLASIVTDLSKLSVVQVKEGTRYFDLPLARPMDPELSPSLSFRQRGAATIDFYPSAVATGRTLRAKYLYHPAKLTNGADVLDAPDGCDTAIVELVSARIRGRQEEDPSLHERRRERVWTETVNSLLPFYQGVVQTVTDVYGGGW